MFDKKKKDEKCKLVYIFVNFKTNLPKKESDSGDIGVTEWTCDSDYEREREREREREILVVVVK